MKTPVWIIDTLLNEGNVQSLEMALSDNDTEYVKTKYLPFSTVPEIDLKDFSNAVIYGTVEFVRQIQNIYILTPGAYLNNKQLMFSHYACYYHEFLMNKDFEIRPFGLIKKAWKENEPYSNGAATFIRPDVVTKTFAGQLFVTAEDLEDINRLEHVPIETLCILASNKRILEETRFLVVNKKVVAGSTYKKQNELFISGDYDPKAKEFLEDMLNKVDWVPDSVFIADIALFQDQSDVGYHPKAYGLIECNSFSCAGLYDMNLFDVVKHVNEAAIKEFYGDI